MPTSPAPAKTPRVAFQRALTALGLQRGVDYRITVRQGVRSHGAEAGPGVEVTDVELRTPRARLAVAEGLEAFAARVAADGGHVARFRAYERGDLAISTQYGSTSPREEYWLAEVLRIARAAA